MRQNFSDGLLKQVFQNPYYPRTNEKNDTIGFDINSSDQDDEENIEDDLPDEIQYV